MQNRWVVSTAVAVALAIGTTACNRATPTNATTTPGAAQQAQSQPGDAAGGGCAALPDADHLKQLLKDAPGKGEAGGIAGGRYSWAAVVDRKGELCALAVSSDDQTATWPGSRGIAIAKASTANGFSSDTTPISTARLYTMAQPGHSLYSAANGNPFNPECAGSAEDLSVGKGKVCGGTVVFGGGVPLYRNNSKVGGLGISGDTSCTDHEIAKRVRDAAGLNPAKGATVDDIVYTKADGPSVFAHPLCGNTWRNGMKIGDEPPASGY
jgi:uncharacterized protein GlcG (DUF336 family)